MKWWRIEKVSLIDFNDLQFEHKKPWLIFKYTWIDAQKWAWTKSDAKFEIKTLGLNAESVLGVSELAPPMLEGSSPTKIKLKIPRIFIKQQICP